MLSNDKLTGKVRLINPSLPVFRLLGSDPAVFYSPDCPRLFDTAAASEVEQALCSGESGHRFPAVAELLRKAEEAVQAWGLLASEPFEPERLVIYPSNDCCCACQYCYAAPFREPLKHDDCRCEAAALIREEVVLAAARLVARCCKKKGRPFQLAMHGGGEPTLHWAFLKTIVSLTHDVADHAGIPWRGYIATNGIMPEEHARWLARYFNEVGLSCDGPPEIQDAQRPLSDGSPTSEYVERTADILFEHETSFNVRATITPSTVERQEEIVEWLCEHLHANAVRFEPVYVPEGVPYEGFKPVDASRFADHFLAARRRARELHCRLSFSGARLDQVHSTYCDVLRQALHLTPDGTATSCFFSVDGGGAGTKAVVGRYDEASGEFVLDYDRIDARRRAATSIPDRCRQCVNVFHCARECPEVCRARSVPAERDPSFRCLVTKELTVRSIIEAAAGKRDGQQPTQKAAGQNDAIVAALLAEAPKTVDADEVMQQWKLVRSTDVNSYLTLPPPPWQSLGFQQSGQDAWRLLTREHPGGGGDAEMSVYLHVPFCDRKCPFCQCYSIPLGRHNAELENAFVGKLLEEIDQWAGIEPVSRRPVTTVHFGGGTPSLLSTESLRSIVGRLKSRLNMHSNTEWALESTTSMLTRERIMLLRELGFTRLHAGVQTLEDDVRPNLGRRDHTDQVLERITSSIDAGFTVSVDIMYGLPGQTIGRLMSSLDLLIDSSVHGFSLYRLRRSMPYRRLLERQGRLDIQPAREYVFFQVCHQHLLQRGYEKKHALHFSRPQDAYLYYTHAVRGEDLLALGPTADGIFGDYRYRHGKLGAYVAGTECGAPVLQGGMRDTQSGPLLRLACAQLQTGTLDADLIRKLGAGYLLHAWQAKGLVRPLSKPGYLGLTANGSWLLANMIARLSMAHKLPSSQ